MVAPEHGCTSGASQPTSGWLWKSKGCFPSTGLPVGPRWVRSAVLDDEAVMVPPVLGQKGVIRAGKGTTRSCHLPSGRPREAPGGCTEARALSCLRLSAGRERGLPFGSGPFSQRACWRGGWQRRGPAVAVREVR